MNARAVLTVLAVALLLTGRKLFANILPAQRIRVDDSGDGHYGSTRTGHIHEGVDLVAWPGEPVRSPISGTVVRITNAYADSNHYKGIVIEGAGYQVKLLYVRPVAGLDAPDFVSTGEVIGTAQDIVERYGPPMTNHIHVEARTLPGLQTVDPAPLLGIA